ncbi:WxL domain-containing protein [Enterococcus faecalis]|uniref:WxL domain-containing protein n=1 Tax=Enterococcus faecalis TaxID=1351 RepID=UPI000CF699CD|nr:WxL domain-containing protein [Enterococcus faecalis]PQC13594.1 cell surface protein [Enterococcus faecalis]
MKKTILATLCTGILVSVSAMPLTSVHADEVTPKDSIADFSITDKDPEHPTDPENGTLTLKQVPSFNYGILEASSIYSGFTNRTATAEGTLTISDTRLGKSDWTLTADMGKFENEKTSLEGAALELAATGTLGENLAGIIKDDNSPSELAKGNGSHGKDEFVISAENAKLSLGANPKADLANNDTFETTINWNLSSTLPVVPEA